jgi:hypothetical protein
VLAFVGIQAIARARATFSADAIAMTFIPMVLLMAVAFLAQWRSTGVVASLVPIVIGAAGLLLFSMLNHGLPEYSVPLAIAHLVVVLVGGAWAGYILFQGAR